MLLNGLLRRRPAAAIAVAAVAAIGGPLVVGAVTVPSANAAGMSPHHAAAPHAALPAGAGSWSDPATWGGWVPQSDADVEVPAGRTVVLDQDVTVGNLTVNGTLLCGPGDLALTAKNILVNGLLQCGTPQERRTSRFTITLTETDQGIDLHGMGSKVLGVMGRLKLYGQERPPFAKISMTAPAGATKLYLDRGVNWRVGDHVVVASTDYDMNQAEERTVVAVNGRTVTLDEPLTYEHYGRIQKYHSPRNRTGVNQIDTRGEVALLSRDIVIQGSDEAASTRFGGHVMVMAGGFAHVSGVEFRRMGQLGKLARYPFHWHRLGDGSGQVIENSSIHDAYNRCVSVHGTDNTVVRNNVCSNTYGHGFITENGEETGTTFIGNIGLLTRTPPPGMALLPSDTQKRGNEPIGPATYWVTNPDNTIVNNVAAGSDGSGFWISPHDRSLEKQPAKVVKPRRTVLRRMDFNSAHSVNGFPVVLGAAADMPGDPHYFPAGKSVVSRMTAWKTSSRGLWADASGVVFERAAVADNNRATFLTFASEMRNSLIVGESGNRGTPRTPHERAAGRSLPLRNNGIMGHTMYDGPSRLDNVYATGFDRDAPNVVFFVPQGAATKSLVSAVHGLALDPSTRRIGPDGGSAQTLGFGAFTAIRDEDGSVVGAGRSLVTGEPLMRDGSCGPAPKARALFDCPHTYATLLATPNAVANGKLAGRMTITRSDGVSAVNDVAMGVSHFQFPVITDAGYSYQLSMEGTPASRVRLRLVGLPGTVANVTVNLPQGQRTVTLWIPYDARQVIADVG